MLNEDEFLVWAESFYNIGYIFEGRHDIYPNCRKWVDEWYLKNSFSINKDDIIKLERMLGNHDYDVFLYYEKNKDKIKAESDFKFRNLISTNFYDGCCDNIGKGIAPYLFTWNYQRYKEYIKRNMNMKNGFDLITYFTNLGEYLDSLKKDFLYFSDKKLCLEPIQEEMIYGLYNKINEKLKELGVGNNEPVGTAKILHMMAPYYFPLIDNDIAETIGLKIRGESLNKNKYLSWMKHLKICLGKYNQKRIEKFENKLGLSILKMVDGGLYMMCSIQLKKRVDKTGFNLHD